MTTQPQMHCSMSIQLLDFLDRNGAKQYDADSWSKNNKTTMDVGCGKKEVT
jgi:hypothetical protein